MLFVLLELFQHVINLLFLVEVVFRHLDQTHELPGGAGSLDVRHVLKEVWLQVQVTHSQLSID